MSKKILLICRTRERGYSKYENLRFKESADKLSYDLDISPFDELILENILRKEYDFVLPRTGSGAGTDGGVLSFLETLELNKVKLVNSKASSQLGCDKYESLKLASRVNGVLIPKTFLLQSYADYEKTEWSSFPAVLKARYGAKGRGVFLIQDSNSLKKLLNQYPEMLIQQYIKESKGRDIRVFVCGNKVLGAISRQSNSDDFRANVALGGKVKSFEPEKKLIDISISITKNFGLTYCGLDFLIGHDGFYFCEANIHPDFQGFEKATGIDAAGEILSIL